MMNDYPAAKVHITGSDIPLGQPPAAPKRKRKGAVTRSYILTANDPAQPILPQSDSRCEAWITAIIAEIEANPANPAAGANAVYTITQPCQLSSVAFTAATSATVSNRQGVVLIKDGSGNLIAGALASSAQTATQTVAYAFGQGFGGGQAIQGGQETSGLPAINLQTGWTITIGLNNIQAGDQISNITLTLTNANSAYVAKTKGDAIAIGNSATAIPAAGTPFPLNTTDELWAGSTFLPCTISTLAIYEQNE